MKKISITKKERLVMLRLLNNFIDSDYFTESLPKGIKSEKEANEAMASLLKKIDTKN